MDFPKYATETDNMTRKWVGQRLNWARKRAGFLTREAAHKLDRSEHWIESIETGFRNITMVDFLKLCALYSATPDQVLNARPLSESELMKWRKYAHARPGMQIASLKRRVGV